MAPSPFPRLLVVAACALLLALVGWRAIGGGDGMGEGGRRPAPEVLGTASAAPVPMPGAGAEPEAAPAEPGPAASASAGTSAPAEAVVHVVGAVRRPGVYRLSAGARVQEAIDRAGGAARRAELAGVNLAARVADAQQIIVPTRGDPAPAPTASTDGTTDAPGANGGGPASAPIDLNAATAEQLETLDGVGPVTARKILAFRASAGRFRSVDELEQVPGIGPKRLAAIRPRVRV